MALYDTNNHICMQLIDFLFHMVVCIANQWVVSDETLGGVNYCSGFETGLHEVRSVSIFLFDDPLVAKSILSVAEVLQGVLDVGV